MYAAGTGIVPERLSVSIGKLPVPCGRSSRTARVHRAFGIIPHALRTVCHADARDAEPRDFTDIKTVDAADIRQFFLKCHFGHEFGCPLFGSLGNDMGFPVVRGVRSSGQWRRCGQGRREDDGRYGQCKKSVHLL